MNFINRAFKNVTRKYSKSVLLILTFFLIGNLVIIGLGVSSASDSAKILTRKKMRAVVTYAIDYNKVWRYTDTITDEDELNEFYNNYPRVKVEDVAGFLSDPRVKIANAVSTDMWFADTEKKTDFVHLNNSREEGMNQDNESCYTLEDGTMQCETYQEPIFLVKSNLFAGMIEFEDEEFRVVEGRFYSEDDVKDAAPVCIITQALAQQNGLNVGDTITLAPAYLTAEMKRAGVVEEDIDTELEVIGIYSHNSPVTPDASNYDYMSPWQNPDNVVLMPTTTAYAARIPSQAKVFDYYAEQNTEMTDYYTNPDNYPSMENMERNMYIESVTFLLDDPMNVDQFVEDYEDSVSQFASLDANNDEFNRLSKPLDTLSMYADFITTLVVVNAIVIISLVTALTLKTREYEIGVLLSIGASKFKVIAQFFIELALVAIVGFTLAVVSGSMISKEIGYRVLEMQIAESEVGNEEEEYDWGYIDPWSQDYTTEITLDDLVSEYEVTISPAIIAEIYVLGLGIVLISVIIPSFMIMRYNPKQILMNTN